MAKTNWSAVGFKDGSADKEPTLPSERGLSAGEKLFGMLIPGVNILIAAEELSGDTPTSSDDKDYLAAYAVAQQRRGK